MIAIKSLKSSSSGNSLLVYTNNTRILIDCGLGSMKKTRQCLDEALGGEELDAVLVSHNHSDHISYYPLRVLEERNASVYIYQNSQKQLKDKHFRGYGFSDIDFQTFNNTHFEIGDVQIFPFQLNHQPDYPTFGFEILHRSEKKWQKMVYATDFNDYQNVTEHFVDSDMIFVESNHDLELLRQYYNPNSRYHLSNSRTAQLLYEVRKKSRNKFSHVRLGHLSGQRNTGSLAVDEIKHYFAGKKSRIDFDLDFAPADVVSKETAVK